MNWTAASVVARVSCTLVLAVMGCSTVPLAYRGSVLVPRESAPPNRFERAGETVLLHRAEGESWTAAMALIEFREILVLDVLLLVHGPGAVEILPDFARLADFTGQAFTPLVAHDAANRFMGPRPGTAPFYRAAFRPKADYWIAGVDYGYPQIPQDVVDSVLPGDVEGVDAHAPLREALGSTLTTSLRERLGGDPREMVESIFREGLASGATVGARTTLRFNLTWRNEQRKIYPLELRVPSAGAALRIGPG